MDRAHNVESIAFSGTIMQLRVDGRDYEIDISRESGRLSHATPEQQLAFVVSPSGYGIHWPQIDEDLSIDGLIGVTHEHPKTKAMA